MSPVPSLLGNCKGVRFFVRPKEDLRIQGRLNPSPHHGGRNKKPNIEAMFLIFPVVTMGLLPVISIAEMKNPLLPGKESVVAQADGMIVPAPFIVRRKGGGQQELPILIEVLIACEMIWLPENIDLYPGGMRPEVFLIVNSGP